MQQLHLRIFSLAIALIGLAICAYKVSYLGLPLTPDEDTDVWVVQARLAFKGNTGPAKVAFAVPGETPGFTRLDEDFISGGYGLGVEEEGFHRRVDWAKRRAKGSQVLYYRVTLAESLNNKEPFQGKAPKYPERPQYPEPYDSAITSILDDVRAESADTASFSRELIKQVNAEEPNENIKLIRSLSHGRLERVDQLVEMLQGARIPSRVLYGLMLNKAVGDVELQPILQVFNGEEWLSFDPTTGEQGMPDEFLVWMVGEPNLVASSGTGEIETTFSMARVNRDVIEVATARADAMDSRIMDVSLLNLPLQTQNVYKILLTVPLGALMIVLLRNIIGLRTFGTFMPILMSLAFRETQLVLGVILFVTITAIGLLVRFYLERMMLLLVPRLAAMVTIVLLIMLGVSLLSNSFGIERALSVALFPMVIIAMTIERMSLSWEEHGAQHALLEGGGSLVAAIMGYLVMSNPVLTHLVFIFPELLLIVLAVILVLGRYTGYRLSELWRFRNVEKWENK